MVYWLASGGRVTDTHREKESESGHREGEEGSGNWFLGMFREVWRRREWRQGWPVFEAGH